MSEKNRRQSALNKDLNWNEILRVSLGKTLLYVISKQNVNKRTLLYGYVILYLIIQTINDKINGLYLRQIQSTFNLTRFYPIFGGEEMGNK